MSDSPMMAWPPMAEALRRANDRREAMLAGIAGAGEEAVYVDRDEGDRMLRAWFCGTDVDMRLYLHHRPECGSTEVRVEANYSGPGRMFMVRPEQVFPYEEEREYVHVAPGDEPPLYCPPIPDAEMARLLGIRP